MSSNPLTPALSRREREKFLRRWLKLRKGLLKGKWKVSQQECQRGAEKIP